MIREAEDAAKSRVEAFAKELDDLGIDNVSRMLVENFVDVPLDEEGLSSCIIH